MIAWINIWLRLYIIMKSICNEVNNAIYIKSLDLKIISKNMANTLIDLYNNILKYMMTK